MDRSRSPSPARRPRSGRASPPSGARRPRGSGPSTPARPRSREGAGEELVQELLELAFHRASKVSVSGDTTLQRQRRMALRKIGRASGNLLRQLRLRAHPFEDEATLGSFRTALLEEKWGPGGRFRHLLRLRRAQERLIRFRTEEERRIPKMEEREEIARSVRRYYGRSASVLREVAGDLLRLREGEKLLRDRPALDATSPIVVVAGYPNVGKSSLVARLTRARPRIAPYPFTTVAVAVGHTTLGPRRQAQVVDTPGMLEREETRRNPIEREAFLAVREGGPLVIFLLDPSGSCGWPLAEQEALLVRLKRSFPDRTFLEVENKVDLSRGTSDRSKISCLTGEGIEALQERIGELLKTKEGGLPPLPPIRDEEYPLEDEDSESGHGVEDF